MGKKRKGSGTGVPKNYDNNVACCRLDIYFELARLFSRATDRNPMSLPWRKRFLKWLEDERGYEPISMLHRLKPRTRVSTGTTITAEYPTIRYWRTILNEKDNFIAIENDKREKRNAKRRRLTEGAGESKITESRTDEEQDAVDAAVIAAFEEPKSKKSKKRKR